MSRLRFRPHELRPLCPVHPLRARPAELLVMHFGISERGPRITAHCFRLEQRIAKTGWSIWSHSASRSSDCLVVVLLQMRRRAKASQSANTVPRASLPAHKMRGLYAVPGPLSFFMCSLARWIMVRTYIQVVLYLTKFRVLYRRYLSQYSLGVHGLFDSGLGNDGYRS